LSSKLDAGLELISALGAIELKLIEMRDRAIWFPYDAIITNEQNLLDPVRGFGKKWETGNTDYLLIEAVTQFSRIWSLLKKGELLIDVVTQSSPAWAVVMFEGIRCLAKIDAKSDRVQFSNFLDLELREKIMGREGNYQTI
jgi:hypothetical protein